MLDIRSPRAGAWAALALVLVACGKNSEAGGDVQVPEVSAAAGVPDVASGAPGDAEERELARYQLTMADVRKWAAASQKLQALEKQHPELADTDSISDDSDAELSLDAIEASIERIPAARNVVEQAGMSAREYAVISFALLQASFAQMLVQQGHSADSAARQLGTHPANVRFVKEHEAELAKYKEP